MASNEKVLEELYELLDLYFSVSLPGGIVCQEYKGSKDAQPALDRIVFKELILAKITRLIIENYCLNCKEDSNES